MVEDLGRVDSFLVDFLADRWSRARTQDSGSTTRRKDADLPAGECRPSEATRLSLSCVSLCRVIHLCPAGIWLPLQVLIARDIAKPADMVKLLKTCAATVYEHGECSSRLLAVLS